MTPLAALDYASVIVFAISGALAASRAQLDLVGFAFVACLTAVGGGTLRDLLLNREAVFWVADPTYIVIACLVAAVVFFTAHLFESRQKALLWADAIALSVAVAAGAGVALNLGQPPVIVALMGVATGCFGGMMRDVVCNEVPLILKHGELYASAALAGPLALLLASQFEIPGILEFIICAIVTFILRAGSLAWGWSLPVYKSRPPKN
ncbi:trimeric intracellular cation channel family protein [Celeribacter sp. PS-C1]|uniref:trimeric intracellular cation channel family protein n=1 Tax=Celeribacter sp. PS-C1 TaxID=2820813 RepID=UPI001C67235D|nr:trimeric intracellular cation channel family protein [Celeribacter sp. PS-C1]MBW6416548.1 trimeric intracellular cation channel family protein [Celeribacter sp. PS-C1]